MGAYRWLDERMDLAGVKRALLDREVPDRLSWLHTLGSATLTVFMVQIATGIVLATYYASSPDHAYDSIQYVQREVTGGALLRGIHHWAASAMVVLVVAHMLRVFAMGAYKYPREANWLIGVGLLMVVLGFGFTGYLLPWDQKAYWATQVGTNIAGTTPVLGPLLVKVLRGGSQLGAATLSRFYAFHVLWLPLLLGGMALLHLSLVIRQGIAPAPGALEQGAPARTSSPAYPAYYRGAYAATKRAGVRFWPDIVAKDLFVAVGVTALLVSLAAAFPAGLEPPADPTDTSYVPRPEWYFLPFYQLLKLVPGRLEGVVTVGVPLALVLVLVGLPFYDRRSIRSLVRRPFALVSLAGLLGGMGLLLGASVKGSEPLAPPEVGRPLTSEERAGRALFRQHCGSCHAVAGRGGGQEADAPELTDIGLHHTSGWLHSFIEEPTRFHRDSEMPSFGPPVLTHPEVEEIAVYLASLRGLPPAPREPEYHDTFPEPPKAKSPGGGAEKR